MSRRTVRSWSVSSASRSARAGPGAPRPDVVEGAPGGDGADRGDEGRPAHLLQQEARGAGPHGGVERVLLE